MPQKPIDRSTALEFAKQHPNISVLIVGGGINGAGLFRELALQGMDVLLVDKSDFCAGASAASSRMIHGGLRYLEFGEFRLVRESLAERNRLLNNAPHYVRPLPTVIPVLFWFSGIGTVIRRFFGLRGQRPAHRGALMVKLGLLFYDLFTGKSRHMPRHTFLSRGKARSLCPLLPDVIKCAAEYHDAWVSYPERLCLEVIQEGVTVCENAHALNYVSLKGVDKGKVLLHDSITGEDLRVCPKILVNATGAWIDFTNTNLGLSTKLIGGTKGAHLVLENQELYNALGGKMIYYENNDGRVAVALPWLGKSLIGSTDIPVGNPDEVECEDSEITYMFDALREVFPNLKVDHSQILSCFCGVRPLPKSNAPATVEVSRDHSSPVIEPTEEIPFPVYSLVGGKWTTFRGFAESVADKILPRLDAVRKVSSKNIPIGGGRNYPHSESEKRTWIDRLQQETGLTAERLSILLARYGTRAEDAAKFLIDAEDAPLQYHEGYTRREIEYIIENEAVCHVEDIVLRRTALALLGEVNKSLLEELAQLAGASLNWTEAVCHEEAEGTADFLRKHHRIQITEN